MTKVKKIQFNYKQRSLAARAIKEFACLWVLDLGIPTGPGTDLVTTTDFLFRDTFVCMVKGKSDGWFTIKLGEAFLSQE